MSKALNTRRWLWRAIVTTSLIPLMLVELGLVGAYLLSHQMMHEHHIATLEEESSKLLAQAMEREADLMEADLAGWERQATLLAEEARRALGRQVDTQQLAETLARHRLEPDGVYHAPDREGGAASFYSALTPPEQQNRRKVAQLATLDPLFAQLVESDPRIRQVYVNTFDSYNRLWPWFDARATYASDLNIPAFSFYYLADERHNPERQPVWTDAYIDPAGAGWMVSAVAPVYREGFLEGVAGLDITLNELIERLLSVELPWSGYAVLVGRDGKLLAIPPEGEDDFGITELTGNADATAVREDIVKPRHFNLRQLSDDPALREVLGEARGVLKSHLGDESRLLAWQELSGVGWTLLTVIDEDSAFAASNSLAAFFRDIGYLMIVGLAVFYGLLLVMSGYRSRKLSRTLVEPLHQLCRMAADIGARRPVAKPQFALSEFDMAGEALAAASREQQSALVALATEEGRLGLALDASGGTVLEYDIANDRLMLDEDVFHRLGLAPLPAVSMDYFHALIHPDDLVHFESQRLRTINGEETVGEAELRLRHADGSWRWVLMRGSVLLRNEAGEALHVFGVVLDIHHQKQTAAELERARDEAQRTQHAQSRLFSRVSHELRTPLNAILGFAELLQSEDKTCLSKQERGYLSEVARAADRLDGLFEDVLQLASLESGELKLECGPQSAARSLQRNAAQLMPYAIRAGVQLEMTEADAGVWLQADRRRLDQVLQNLIENAIKYNRRGGWVRLSAWVEGDWGCLEITDNGLGIAEERRDELFSPFARLGMEHSEIQGTGLGLTLSQELVSRMQGHIEVTSRAGEGSRFRVWLPGVDVQAHQAAVKRGLPDQAQLQRQLTLLLVGGDDDTRVYLDVLAEQLGNLELVSAQRHAQAMRLANEQCPTLLVCCSEGVSPDQASELLQRCRRLTGESGAEGYWIGPPPLPSGFRQRWQALPQVAEVWLALRRADSA